jgi:two-component sensor histidine kinase
VAAVLCENLQRALGNQFRIIYERKGETVLPADLAISLSLALNELVTNSAKHCTGHDCASSVRVSCRKDEGQFTLVVEDDGPGFPPGFDPYQSNTFGMQLIRNVVAGANGQFDMSNTGGGARVTISLPMHGTGKARRDAS